MDNAQPANNTLAAVAPKTFFTQLSTELQKREDEYRKLLPAYLTPKRFWTIVYQSIARTPALQECSIASILNCVMQAADLGLEIGGANGHAYMVPFNNTKTKKKEAQFIPGYKGLAHLAYLTGEVTKINTRLVYENDVFEIEYGIDEHLIHRPAKGDRGKGIGAYATVKLANGETKFEFMDADELEEIHQRSKAADSGPWITDPGEMRKKTVFKRVQKLIPSGQSIQGMKLAQAIELDNTATGYDVEAESSPAHEPERLPSQMADDDESVVEREDPEAFLTDEQQVMLSTAVAKKKHLKDADFEAILNKYNASDLKDLKQGHLQAVMMELISL